MGVQECEAKTTDEDHNMEETEVVSDNQIDGFIESIDECLFAALVCDPPVT